MTGDGGVAGFEASVVSDMKVKVSNGIITTLSRKSFKLKAIHINKKRKKKEDLAHHVF